MVRAWYMDDEPTDQRLEHQRNPPQFLTLEELFKITGVEYFKVTTLLSVLMTCKYAVVVICFFLLVECRNLHNGWSAGFHQKRKGLHL